VGQVVGPLTRIDPFGECLMRRGHYLARLEFD
jgi:hypothetical protein